MNDLGFFGGRRLNLIDIPVKEKLNILQEYKDVLSGIPMKEDALVPLLNWFSNHKRNIEKIQKVNQRFFFVSKRILSHSIFWSIDRSVRFIKYPKKNKETHELDFLVPYILRYYNWSEKEYDFYKDLIDLEDEELHKELDKQFAFDKKECRKLGISRTKIRVKYESKPKIRGFF